MKNKHSASVIIVLMMLFLLPNLSHARLKDYVPIIKVKYHQKTKDTFNNIATYFEKRGDPQAAEFFRSYAESGSWGSGFIVVDKSGNNYIITNRHVVEQSENVDVVFENEDGSEKIFQDCPIVYTDNDIDLAVVQFPDNKRVFKRGFDFDTGLQRERTEVFSAGFPHLLNRPGWQLSAGIISNEKAYVPEMMDPDITYLIQHSATIDSGNSGGPLLIEDRSNPLGYRVIGVNTWKITNRENVNFSIPAMTTSTVLEKAKAVEEIYNNTSLLKEELLKNCRTLSEELGSDEPDLEVIYRYISYAIVGENGWESFLSILDAAPNRKEREIWERSFFYNPVQTMRNAIFYHFWMDLSESADLSSITFTGINPADDGKIGTPAEIRANYKIGDAAMEIAWNLEYGHWRISRLDFSSLPGHEVSHERERGPIGRVTRALSGDRIILLGIRTSIGSASARGDVYNFDPYSGKGGVFNYSIGIEAEYSLSPYLWVASGLNYVRKGMQYEQPPLEYKEHIGYLQIPLMIKLRTGFFLGAGLGLNFRVNPGGEKYDTGTGLSQELTSSYYDDINAFNFSLLLTGGVEYFLRGSSTIVGFDITLDYHLFNDKDFTANETSRYYTISAGGSIKFGFVR